MNNLVYVDIETSGLDENIHEVIQIGAVATNNFQVLDTFEIKLTFDVSKASEQALAINAYDENIWEADAVHPKIAVEHFSNFLRKFADRVKQGKNNRRYKVTDLCAHNSSFEEKFLKKLFEAQEGKLIVDRTIRDTLQLAALYEDFSGVTLESKSLGNLVYYFKIEFNPFDTHDALYNAHLLVKLHQKLLQEIRNAVKGQPYSI